MTGDMQKYLQTHNGSEFIAEVIKNLCASQVKLRHAKWNPTLKRRMLTNHRNLYFPSGTAWKLGAAFHTSGKKQDCELYKQQST